MIGTHQSERKVINKEQVGESSVDRSLGVARVHGCHDARLLRICPDTTRALRSRRWQWLLR
eukprot:4546217-Pleurochrysis_carterae.AAC.2